MSTDPLARPGLVACCLAWLMLTRLALAAGLVPPWQNPDEPQHVLGVMNHGRHVHGDAELDVLQRRIIESMAEYRWWEQVGLKQPAHLPSSFYNDPELQHMQFGLPGGGGFYYRVAAAWAWLAGADGPVEVLRATRVLSTMFGVGVVLVGYAAARRLIGDWAAAGAGTLVALHPQLALVAATAGPDAFIALCGAITLWACVSMSGSRHGWIWLAVAGGAVVAATFARRIGVTLVPIALWYLGVGGTRHGRARAVGAGAILLALTGALAGWLRPDSLAGVYEDILDVVVMPERGVWAWPELEGFNRSAWLTAGWLRIGPPDWWMTTASCGMLVATFGLVRALRHREATSARRTILLLGGAATIQVVAIYYAYIRVGLGPQGRFLAPAAVPLLLLLWFGLASAAPAWLRWAAGVAAVALMLLLDLTAWFVVLVPAFAG